LGMTADNAEDLRNLLIEAVTTYEAHLQPVSHDFALPWRMM